MKCIPLLIWIAFQPFCGSFGQSVTFNDEFNKWANDDNPKDSLAHGFVIALGGLNLRDEPSFKGKIVTSIPFGTQVAWVEHWWRNPKIYKTEIMTSDSIRGWWVKTKVGNKNGWAFSAFMDQRIRRMEDDYYFILPNKGWCWSDAYASLSYYYYYGFFPNSDSSKYVIKPIKPTFYSRHEMMGVAVRSNTKKQPAFIVASHQEMQEGEISTKTVVQPLISFAKSGTDQSYKYIKNNQSIQGYPYEIRAKDNNNYEDKYNDKATTISLFNKDTGKSAILLESDYGSFSLVWIGDINHDGMPDLILENGGEGEGCGKCTFLLLSNPIMGEMHYYKIQEYCLQDCC